MLQPNLSQSNCLNSEGLNFFDGGKGSLNWEYEVKDYILNKSKGVFELPPGYAFLQGHSAKTFLNQLNEQPTNKLEAVMVNPNTNSLWTLSYFDVGYIASNSNLNLDKGRLMEQMLQAAAEENQFIGAKGQTPLFFKNWLEEPTWDESNQTVSWALNIEQGEKKIVNLISLKMGRQGFEKFTWVGTLEDYQIHYEKIIELITNFNFSPGRQYEDFIQGDKLANLDISQLTKATLIGSHIGVKELSGLSETPYFTKYIYTFIVCLFTLGIIWMVVKKLNTPPQLQGV